MQINTQLRKGDNFLQINGLPAATTLISDSILCDDHELKVIAEGSETVFANEQPIARQGDKTTCGAVIQSGSPNVFIGSGRATVAEIEPEFSLLESCFISAVEMGFPPSRRTAKKGLGAIRLGLDEAKKALPKARKATPVLDNVKKTKLKPGTPEHKAQRWKDYQAKPSNKPKWSYERWSKQYDTNMRNATHGLEREKLYREKFGGKSETLKTEFTYRQIDIRKGLKLTQLKTGKVSLTKQAKIDLKKDSALIKEGYEIEYILEKGASKSFLKALDDNGITYTIGSKL